MVCESHDWRHVRTIQYEWTTNSYGKVEIEGWFGRKKVKYKSTISYNYARKDVFYCSRCLEEKTNRRIENMGRLEGVPDWFSDVFETVTVYDCPNDFYELQWKQ